jgi:GNAT superfamily N-acetyltransferase
MINSRIEKAIKLVHERKFSSLLKMTVKSTVPRKLFYFDKLYIVSADLIEWKPRRNSNIVFRQGSLSDVKTISSVYSDKETVRKRFENKYECVLAEIKGKLAGIIWVRFGDNYRTNCEYRFKPEKKYAWIFDAFVSPEFRLRGVFQNLIIVIQEYAYQRSYKGLCGEIHYENKNSLNSHLRLGFNILEEISYISITGWFIYLIKNRERNASRIHIRFVNPFNIGNNFL